MKKQTFGTFAGVFTPTTLTILGVIMYIRHPWVVGNAGVLGAILIILLSVTITFTTALSLSSITTNVKIGAGGAFSLISKSLGIEIGGAIGVPFYFAQAIAVAMYIFGFREGLQTILPLIPAFYLDMGIFALVMTIAFISTSFAFKIQYVILVVIVLSLVSIYGSLFIQPLNFNIQWFGTYVGSPENNFKGTNFWSVFAVFFPAVTGVMAGANMSGDLENPRVNIPVGTISSVILTTIIYLSLVFVAAVIATPTELTSNYNLFIDKAIYGPIVLVGLLGATLSSALGSFVGAPRILQALGSKNILPYSEKLSETSKRGEPVKAMIVTSIIVLIGISLRDLNTIAPLLTMFFMITYAMVNVVALVEQTLALPSFRPTLKFHIVVPLIGAVGSLAVMFIMNPIVALFSIVFIVVFYFYLLKKNIKSEVGDSRSGLFNALAEWGTKKTAELQTKREARSWRPDLLIPMSMPKDIRSSFKLIESIVSPKGSLKILVMNNENKEEQRNTENYLQSTIKKFKERELPVSYTVIEQSDYNTTLNLSMQSLNAAFFKPNTIFISIDMLEKDQDKYNRLLIDAKKNSYGVIVYIPFSTAGLSIEKNIGLWLTNLPENWREEFNIGNNNLSTLISLLICRNWKGNIEVNIIDNNDHINENERDIEDFKSMIRFPNSTNISLLEGTLIDNIQKNRQSDINIINIEPGFQISEMIELVNACRISCVFCADSEYENALA